MAVCHRKSFTLLSIPLWRDNMISRLLKLTLFGCIVIAASVPAEAGIFDRILNRSGTRRAGCCQPQASCEPAPSASTPCASRPCATTPYGSCQSTPNCLNLYHENLALCSSVFGSDPQMCAECQRRAAQAYCGCIKDSGTLAHSCGARAMVHSATAQRCVHPDVPNLQSCEEFYDTCHSADPNNTNCARCWFECIKMSQMPPMVPSP